MYIEKRAKGARWPTSMVMRLYMVPIACSSTSSFALFVSARMIRMHLVDRGVWEGGVVGWVG